MEEKAIQVEYKFSKIEIGHFAIHEGNILPEDYNVQYNTEAQFMYDNNHHVLCSRIAVSALQQDKSIMDSMLLCYFDINPDSIAKMTKEGKITFPAPFLIQLASLCYGTLRGVIHTKTEGTPLNHFILPPLYFHSVIKNDFIIVK